MPAAGAEPTDLALDRFLARESPLHRADARLKFLLTVAGILSVSLLPVASWAALAVAWASLAVLSVIARLGTFRLSKGALFALPFMLAALPLVFTRQTEIIGAVDIGPVHLTISALGIREFASLGLKSWISVQAALLLSFTTPFADLIEGLRRLRLPRLLIAIISFMYRYLAVLIDEATRLIRARASRSATTPGRRAGGPMRWRAKVVGGMAGSLFLRSYERSERVYAAMQARGFEGEFLTMGARALPRSQVGWFAVGLLILATFAVAGHLWLPHA